MKRLFRYVTCLKRHDNATTIFSTFCTMVLPKLGVFVLYKKILIDDQYLNDKCTVRWETGDEKNTDWHIL